MAGKNPTRQRRLGAIPALAAATAALALAWPGGAIDPAPASAQNCAQPTGLSPGGDDAERFTMLLRVNQQLNVDAYTSVDTGAGGLRPFIRKQDIFVINTRFEGSTPSEWAQMASELRAAFPCNRIAALNGMGVDPERSGYAYAMIDHPAIYALLTDFEPMDWDDDPSRPPWSYNARLAMKRIKVQNTRLAATIAISQGASKRSGLVPLDLPNWNYGEIAQDLDKKNRRLGGRKLGPLSIQTQDHCAEGGPSSFRARTKLLFDQYRFRVVLKTIKRKVKGKGKGKGKVKKRKIRIRRPIKKRSRPLLSNLSLQISFSNTPNPSAGMAITRTSAKTAAACAHAGLKRGAGAFFFFASTDSLALLFQQPQIAVLRPAKSGGGSSGGVTPP